MGLPRNRKRWVLGALAATVGALWIPACDAPVSRTGTPGSDCLNPQPLPPNCDGYQSSSSGGGSNASPSSSSSGGASFTGSSSSGSSSGGVTKEPPSGDAGLPLPDASADATPDGATPDGATPDGGTPDAEAGTENDSGYDGGPGACGTMTCEAGEVCVVNQQEGGAYRAPNDAGQCPDGEVLTGVSCSPAPSYQCLPVPAACAGGLSCGCAQSLCKSGHSCMSVMNGVIGCYQFVP